MHTKISNAPQPLSGLVGFRKYLAILLFAREHFPLFLFSFLLFLNEARLSLFIVRVSMAKPGIQKPCILVQIQSQPGDRDTVLKTVHYIPGLFSGPVLAAKPHCDALLETK